MQAVPIYKISFNHDASIMGHLPQVSEDFSSYYRRHPDRRPSFTAFEKISFPEQPPDLAGIAFHKDATRAHVPYCDGLPLGIGLLLSNEMQEAISALDIGRHRYYGTRLTRTNRRGQANGYRFLYLLLDHLAINFSRSCIVNHFDPDHHLAIGEASELAELAARNIFAKPVSWCLNRSLDIFRVPMEDGILVTKRAREVFEEIGSKGLTFTRVERFSVFFE